MLANKD